MNNLYKFRRADKYSLSALANSQLWFDSITNQNDPFEGQFVVDVNFSEEALSHLPNLYEPDQIQRITMIQNLQALAPVEVGRKIVNATTLAIVDTVRQGAAICSLSASPASEEDLNPIFNSLLWGHYAEGLRGFCLVFDTEQLVGSLHTSSGFNLKVLPIKYTNAPSSIVTNRLFDIDDMGLLQRRGLDDFFIPNILATKSLHWKSENEVRLLTISQSKLLEYNRSSLKSVVLGEKMPISERNLVVSIVKSTYPDAKIQVAKIKEHSYDLELIDSDVSHYPIEI
ncbi:DUF2971 domain-containing protein [Vibrio cholerae]|uniref:DUF2971 domain-containing protein n=1 Tax=Vibrio cholerae TaxID=666 RepID=UPI0029524D55|nr:DUF2971 domain-containing protein [Vibrio cholerae]EHS7464073.1 DUF2971 domain-containing protein [Vibrio cholerae]EIA4706685.1 DUF2971 domain-containing protein [Vibrio cholerae]EIC9802736.1 DUF2971 domain-containing protein [Vibrio cholerae]EJL6883148.1 DUF2971 domain-containing protein [Vibrio cholerae]ELS9246383.1 DUF2971 domain-containing protein [Vibrio cholerae]